MHELVNGIFASTQPWHDSLAERHPMILNLDSLSAESQAPRKVRSSALEELGFYIIIPHVSYDLR